MALTLTNTAQAIPRTLPVSGVTPGQSKQRQEFAGLNEAYRALTMTQKSGWQATANAFNAGQGRTGRHKLSAANAFCILNSSRLMLLQPIQTAAPSDIAPPPVMVNVSASATTPTPGEGANAKFSLLVYAPNYDYTVQILAAAPAPTGKPTFPDKAFAPIGFVQSLSATGTDIGNAYAARYGTPQPGAQIALKLVPVSSAGVRRTPLVVLATVTAAPAAEDAQPTDTHLRVG